MSASSSPADRPETAPEGTDGLVIFIPEMDCPVEEAQIRAALEEMPGIRRLRFNLPQHTLDVDAPKSVWPRILEAIAALGFTPRSIDTTAKEEPKTNRGAIFRLIAALFLAGLAEGVDFAAPEDWRWKTLGMALALTAIALSGARVFPKGLCALRRMNLNIDALMTVAVCGAFLIGKWPEAAMVMALYALAEILEARSVERARNAIASLLTLSPAQVSVCQDDGTWLAVPVESVPVGAVARALPGERFALDGRVRKGAGAVDQAPITGESLPVHKAPGDEVFAGTINKEALLEFEVLKPASDTLLARIIHTVEEAQTKRAPMARFIDRFASFYTPAIFFLALALAFGAPLFFSRDWHTSIYEALVLLVIACPCALVISTPVTIASGLAAAARRGILIKGGVYLEEARKIEIVALDKTGTLTEGKPTLIETRLLSAAMPEEAVLRVAHSLAATSNHPVSQAIAAGLFSTDNPILPSAGPFHAEPGRGISGIIDGQDYALGNHRWIEARGQCSPELESRLRGHEIQGHTVTLLASADEVLALFAVTDVIRAQSKSAIAELKTLGVTTVMLTGDNPITAKSIAGQVGIEEVRANLLPEEKLAVIEDVEKEGRITAMVGDGINDSPALSAAHIGFGMGGGTDTATESADVLIMNNDLRRIPETLRLSQKTCAILRQNITLALGVKAVFLALTLAGKATLWMAVFADVGTSLLVILNGLRVLKAGGRRRAQRTEDRAAAGSGLCRL